MKKIILFILVLMSAFVATSAAGNVLSCSFSTSCAAESSNLIYANKNFVDSNNNILSSNVASYPTSNYVGLCCKINAPSSYGKMALNVSFEDFDHVNTACDNGGQNLFFLTSKTNARVGILNYNNGLINHNFNKAFYSKKVCVKLPNQFSSLDLFISNKKSYGLAGYDCLFRINNITNGHISACNSTYDSGKKYDYIVWGKLWENTNSLKCNLDCTSKLDHRVYSECGQKISNCKNVPKVCDGSLYGAWVKYDSNNDGVINSNDNGEIQCSSPWNITRNDIFTNESIKINTAKWNCSNIIKKQYPVIVSNQLVTMDVYMCNRGDNN